MDLVRKDRFEVIFGASCYICLILGLFGIICRDEYDRGGAVYLAECPGAFNPVDKRNKKIHENKVKMLPGTCNGLDELLSVAVEKNFCAGLL